MAVLGYLAKSKRGLRLAFGAYFLYDFSIKMFLISLSMDSFNVTPLKMKIQCHHTLKMKIQKFKYRENKKSFLGEIKNIFHSF